LSERYAGSITNSTAFVDKQDGVIPMWSNLSLALSPEVLASLDADVEAWIDEMTEESYRGFDLLTSTGHMVEVSFDKYVVHFQTARNVMEQWVIVKCRQSGYPKMYTRALQTVYLPVDCYEYRPSTTGGPDEAVSPNVFNLLSCSGVVSTRRHSSMLGVAAVDAGDLAKTC
jgi:hypothetical protein